MAKIKLNGDWRQNNGMRVPDSIREKYEDGTHFVHILRNETRISQKLNEGYVLVEHTDETKKAAQVSNMGDALGKPVSNIYTIGDTVLMAISGEAYKKRCGILEEELQNREKSHESALNNSLQSGSGLNQNQVKSSSKITRELPE